jgi:prepilin-type processing-associated H-X9-DG protein
VVVAIILLLTTLYWGRSGPSGRERRLKACQQNLEKLYIASEIYSRDYAGKYPVTTGARTSEEVLDILVPKYTSDTSVFTCPAGNASLLRPNDSVRGGTISYAYYMGQRSDADPQQPLFSDKQVNTRGKDPGDPLFSSNGSAPGNNHKKEGGNVLFCDGHVQASSARAAFRLPISMPGVVLLNPKP